MADKVALCRVEHDGTVYNYGDPVPQAVIDEHPGAVGVPNPSSEQISNMTEEEMREHLRRLTGNEEG